ncbi:MAG: hypothetical protein R2755_19750 [Acidimicrobiales bacterium]
MIDETALTFVSHWLPPADAPVRFSTWFFAANAPDGLVEIDADEGARPPVVPTHRRAGEPPRPARSNW